MAMETATQEDALRRYRPYPAYKDSGVEWLGEIPEHWAVKRLRFSVSMNPVPSEVRCLAADTEVSFVPMEAIGEMGGLDLSQSKILDDIGQGYTYFRDGDVVVAKITPCFENGKGALVAGLINGIAFGTTELHVLRAGPDVNPRFLFYVSQSDAFRRLGESEMYGAGGQQRVPESFIKDLFHTLPNQEEQFAIASFLDRETARIDALVAKKQRLIELLQERRAALITRAVTKGLDPSVPMKDSGVEWLGEIPEHWEIRPFTKYVKERADYRGKTPTKVTNGIFLVTARNIRMGWIDYECSQEFVAEDEYDEIMRRGLPRIDDILLTTEAPLGNVALVNKENIALAQRVIRFRVRPDIFSSQFALSAMMSGYFQAQLKTLSTGSTAVGLKASKLPMLWLVAPPILEQQAIAKWIQRETERMGVLIERIARAITRLEELRTALISAAVTGKIDVREEVA